MLVNHIKLILRSFGRSKNYTFLNLLGLTSGLVVFILITLYTSYEFSYDSYHEKGERIFRVYKQDAGNFYMGTDKFAVTPSPLAEALTTEFPEVVSATRIQSSSNALIKIDNEVHMHPKIFLADPDVFNIFTIDAITGESDKLLGENNAVALSQSQAIKYFGTTDVLGKVIHYDLIHPMTITGVFKDMPANSHFVMDMVFDFKSAKTLRGQSLNRWQNSSYHTFLLLQEGVDVQTLQSKLPQIRAKYANDPIDEDGQETVYTLQAMGDVHFTQGVNFDIAPTADAQALYIYLGIAFMVLIIAGINYVNLATARSVNRTKEIGVRKVVGASGSNLVFQFLLESFLLVFFSALLSVLVVLMVLPAFSNFINRPLSLDLSDPFRWFFLLLLSLGLSVMAGLYPSWVLTTFKPVVALKGKGEIKQRGTLFKNVLVVFQFTISSALIIGAVVLSQQLAFIQNADMGYERDQIIVLNIRDKGIRDQLKIFKDQVRKIPGVAAVASSSSLPNNISSSTDANWPGKSKETNITVYTGNVDYEFFELYNMEFAAGQAFRPGVASDKKGVILNEAAVKAFGWDDPIGRQYIRNSSDTGRVVGVIKDFNQHSLHLGIEPLQLFFREDQRRVSIKLSGDQLQQNLAAIQSVYDGFDPKYPFDYSYFDDIFDHAYQREMKAGQLAKWFTALTILVACLGLYGLATHKVQQRTKEVGVRKVLGASVTGILALLSRDFVKLLIIAFLVAAPVAYYTMNDWLNGFAFHININVFTMIATLVVMILVAGLTVGYRTYKAAVGNPVKALREE